MGTQLAKVAGGLRPWIRTMAASAWGCMHWRQVRELLGGARSRDAWRLRWKRKPLPAGYLAAVGACVIATIVVPYGEELTRCITKTDPG